MQGVSFNLILLVGRHGAERGKVTRTLPLPKRYLPARTSTGFKHFPARILRAVPTSDPAVSLHCHALC